MNCLNCQKETTNPKFCSRSCAQSYNNRLFPKRKTIRKCAKCDNSVKNYRTNLCESHYKEYLENKFDFTKKLTLGDYWKRKSLQNLHPSSKNAHIRGLGRQQHKELLKKPCAHCGYDKHVELCHIKAIKKFEESATIEEVNSSDNIIQLCPNCHWEFDNL